MRYSWIFIVGTLAYPTVAQTDFQGYNVMSPSYRTAPYPPAKKLYPPSKPYPPANAPYPPASGTGAGATGTGAGVTGAGVTGAGVTGAGVTGVGVTGAGVTGAGVTGAGVTGAGVTGAGVGVGLTGAGVTGAGVTGFGTGPGVGPGLASAGFGPGIGPGPGVGPGLGAAGFGPGIGPGLGVGPGLAAAGFGPGIGPGLGVGPGLAAAGFGPGIGPGRGIGLGPGIGPIPGPGLGPGFGPGPGFGFPPFFPGHFGPNPALLGLRPLCAKLEVLRSYVRKLMHPVLIGAMGFLVFFLIKSLLLPYLGVFAKALESRSGAAGESNLDLIATTVYKAISSRVCMEHIVCQLGHTTKDFSFTKSVVRAIEHMPVASQTYLKIFKDAVLGREVSCQRFTCKKAISSTTSKTRIKEQNKSSQ